MSSRSIKDATKALQHLFSAPKVPPSLPSEARRMLEHFVDENEGRANEQDAANANQHLRGLWEKYVSSNPAKLGAFAGVLKELRPAIISRTDVFDWWQLVLRPVITSTAHKKVVYDDAHDFLVNVMLYDEDDNDSITRASLSNRLARELFTLYITRSRIIETVNRDLDVSEGLQVAQRAENILIAFGKKHPKDFCHCVDELVQTAATRLQALTLLGSFLKHPIAHLYTVSNTSLVTSLLKCLMNDTSTTVLSVALNTLIMLLPHIPGMLGPYLSRLFLVYSRLLCWEKFSPNSTEAQRNLVTDDRLGPGTAVAADGDMHDVGIDAKWDKYKPPPGTVDSATPEVKIYFTFLYGLYPLNFMSYIRKPRKYLKHLSFPGADDFDLDQAVIRSRSDQFRDLHRLHPNFYHFTVDEEMEDPKWIKTDPSDVVADCHALVIRPGSAPTSPIPGPPPIRDLPKVPHLPPFGNGTALTSGRTSPTHSLASYRSGQNWRGAATTDTGLSLESPTSRPTTATSIDERTPYTVASAPSIDDFPLPVTSLAGKSRDVPETNVVHLQRQITLLTNELNFEKWHKAQYSQHISQLARKNVKDATAEAETLNLLHANRALKQQVEQIRTAREQSLKDSALTRKQASNVETHMMERLRTMKKEQEGWMADSAELRRLREEITQYRDLLVACEARELSKTHELEILQRNFEQLHSLRDQLKDANKRLREYEYRDFEFERAKRETEILQREKETVMMKLQRREQEAERSQRAFMDRIAELEARTNSVDAYGMRSPGHTPTDPRAYAQAEAEANAKLAHLKKAYARLMDKHTDLELECQSLRSRLEIFTGSSPIKNAQTGSMPDGAFDFGTRDRDHSRLDTMSSATSRAPDSAYDSYGEYNTQPEPIVSAPSSSDPASRRYAMQTADSFGRTNTTSSRNSTQLVMYNQTAPLDDTNSVKGNYSESSGDTAKERKQSNKIQPQSEVRVYGRGGAQNIKLKPKKEKDDSNKDKLKSGFRGLMNVR